MEGAKKTCWIIAGVFLILTIIFYFNSSSELDSYTARQLGTGSVMNLQGTIFTAACAICTVLAALAALILTALEDLEHNRRRNEVKYVSDICGAVKESGADRSGGSRSAARRESGSPGKTAADRPAEGTPDPGDVESSDPTWKREENSNFLHCPVCDTRMTVGYIRVRKKCPQCGTPYNDPEG